MAQPGVPAAANLYQPPMGPEPMPQPNEVLTQDQWILDQNSIDDLLHELRISQEEEANIAKFEQNGRLDAAHAAAERQALSLRRYGDPQNPQGNSIFERLAATVNNTNTSAALDQLDQRLRNAQEDYGLTNARLHGTQGPRPGEDGEPRRPGAIADAVEADTAHTRARTVHAHVVRSHFADPTLHGSDKQRKQIEAVSLHDAARTAAEAGAARTERAAADRSQNRLGGFHEDLDDFTYFLRDAHNRHRQNINGLQRDVDDELDLWSMRHINPNRTDQEQDVRADLEGLQTYLDTELSPRDGLRAEALANYTRARYRLEQRGINLDSVNGGGQHQAEFTEDRGILLHRGTADEVVLYEDGSTARWETVQGQPRRVRRQASGEEYVAPAQELRLDAPVPTDPLSGQPRQVAEVFKEWDVNRTPQTAAEAHAALNGYLERGHAREQQFQQAIGDCTANINAYNGHIAEIRRVAAAEGRALTTAEQGQITADQTEIQNQQQLRQQADQRMQALREQLSPATYWRSYLEVGTARTANQTRGRFITKQVVAPVAGIAPEVRADGMVSVYDTTLHGRTSREWHIWPDGHTSYLDQASGTWVHLNPNGRP